MSSHAFRTLAHRAAIALAAIAAMLSSAASTAQSIDPALTELVSPASGCMLGAEPVTIRIFNESGGVIAGGTPINLLAGYNASAYASISSGVAYACEAESSGSVKNLRGSLILFHEADLGDWEPLRSEELY